MTEHQAWVLNKDKTWVRKVYFVKLQSGKYRVSPNDWIIKGGVYTSSDWWDVEEIYPAQLLALNALKDVMEQRKNDAQIILDKAIEEYDKVCEAVDYREVYDDWEGTMADGLDEPGNEWVD